METAPSSGVVHHILTVVEYAALATEVLAVTIILVGIASATYSFLIRSRRFGRSNSIDRDYRQNLGRTLLLGLEILVAADVVRTVALDPTIESVTVLGLLILIRTFLSWSLVVEIENRWPWQSPDRRVEQLGREFGNGVPDDAPGTAVLTVDRSITTPARQTPDNSAEEIGLNEQADAPPSAGRITLPPPA